MDEAEEGCAPLHFAACSFEDGSACKDPSRKEQHKIAARSGTGSGKRRSDRARRKRPRGASGDISHMQRESDTGEGIELTTMAGTLASDPAFLQGAASHTSDSRLSPTELSLPPSKGCGSFSGVRLAASKAPFEAAGWVTQAHKSRSGAARRDLHTQSTLPTQKRSLLVCREFCGIGFFAAPYAVMEAGFFGAMLMLIAAGILVWFSSCCLLYIQHVLVSSSLATYSSFSHSSRTSLPSVALAAGVLWGERWGSAVHLLEAAIEWNFCVSSFAILGGVLEGMVPSITSLESILISIQLVCMTAFVPGVHQRIPLLLISDLCLLLTSVLLLLSLSPIAISLPFNAASALAPSLLPDAAHAALGSNSSIAAPAGPDSRRSHFNTSLPGVHPWKGMALADTSALYWDGLGKVRSGGLAVAMAVWLNALTGFHRMLILAPPAEIEAESGGEEMASTWCHPALAYIAGGLGAGLVHLGMMSASDL